MEFAQRRVIQVQAFLILLTMVIFFVPFGEILDFNSYLISNPINLVFMIITLIGLILGLILNAQHEASFKSAYFFGSLFFPLIWGLNSIIEFFDLLIFWDYFYSRGLISAAISFVTVGIYVFYGLYYNDPLDWTSHKVEKFSIQFKPILYGFLALITFVFFVLYLYIDSLIFQNDLDDSFFIINYPNFTIPFVWYLFIGVLMLLLMNSRSLVVFRDRLYFFVPLTLATTTSQWAFNIWEISRVLENIASLRLDQVIDAGFLLFFTIILYVLLPIFLFVVSFWLHQKNKLNLIPYVPRANNMGRNDRSILTKTSTNFDNNDVDYYADSYNDNDVETKTTTMHSENNLRELSSFTLGQLKITRSVLFMVFIHFIAFIFFVIGFNLNIYTLSAGSESVSFSFGELLDLIELLEVFGDSSIASTLLGIYTFLIFVIQLAIIISPLKFGSTFKNYGFLGVIIVNGFHLFLLIIGFILIGSYLNEFNELLNASINHSIGFGVVIQMLIVGMGVFLYVQGDLYTPKVFEALNGLDLNFSSSSEDSNQSPSERPVPRPRPAPGSRPAPRPAPVQGSRPTPRPAPIPGPKPSPRPKENLDQSSSTISSLESNLTVLKRMLDEGLITEEEYKAKKKQQLDKL
jgi:hypothetical protein